MKVKASLHLHTKEDVQDGKIIDYTAQDVIDQAAVFDFKVLAVTNHDKFVCSPDMVVYAKAKGILLLPGVEVRIGRKHMLILNCGAAADEVTDFDQLAKWRQEHPESFIIVPHPNHGMGVSLGLRDLHRYHDLFDAVEHSWFYSKWFNPNRKIERACKELHKPFIATSDLHTMNYLAGDYAVLDVLELTPEAVFTAIRNGDFSNVSKPKTLWELIRFSVWMGLH
ncbi:MAG: PHP domain-containing protein [Patescibacteria group bacterium]